MRALLMRRMVCRCPEPAMTAARDRVTVQMQVSAAALSSCPHATGPPAWHADLHLFSLDGFGYPGNPCWT